MYICRYIVHSRDNIHMYISYVLVGDGEGVLVLGDSVEEKVARASREVEEGETLSPEPVSPSASLPSLRAKASA